MPRRLAPAAGGKNSKRSLRTARATRRYGSATPSDDQIRAQALRSRALAIQHKKLGVNPKDTSKPAVTGKKKPAESKKKPAGKKVKPIKTKPSFDKYLSEQTGTNARNALANASGRGSSANTVSNRDSYSGSRYVKRSLDQALNELTGIMKQEDTQQECRLWKAELNDTFNNLLDNYQDLYKGTYEDDKFNEKMGKDKRKPITNSGRSGAGSLGSDKPTPALGTTVRDMKVMKNILDIVKDTYEDNKFNMEQGKGKKSKITNNGRGSLGGSADSQALGMSDSDKRVMQS